QTSASMNSARATPVTARMTAAQTAEWIRAGAPASWSAAVLCRFSLGLAQLNSASAAITLLVQAEAPEDRRTPKTFRIPHSKRMGLFVAQRLDGVELGGFEGGDDAGQNAHDGAEGEGDQHGVGGDLGRVVDGRNLDEQFDQAIRGGQPGQPTDERDDRAL